MWGAVYGVDVFVMSVFFYRELIRKKALMVMHRFYLLSPSSITHLFNDIRRCLSDSDPGVMDTCLELLIILVKVCSVCTCEVKQLALCYLSIFWHISVSSMIL